MGEDSLRDRGIHRQKLAHLSLGHPRHVQDRGILRQSTKQSTKRRKIAKLKDFKRVIAIEFLLNG